MIDPRELRIGNYISDIHASDGCFFDVESIGDKICIYGAGFRSRYENLKPIPLTEEWLLEFGFVKIEAKEVFYIFQSNINLKVSKDFKMVAWHNLILEGVETKYVHQLQNLTYTLTGKELTINQHENAI